MLAAPLRPAAIASMAVSGPRGGDVAAGEHGRMRRWPACAASVLTALRSISTPSRPLAKSSTMAWPMATMTVSQAISTKAPSMGSGRRRPCSSGSPSLQRCSLMALTLPPPPMISTGATRYSMLDLLVEAFLDLLARRRHLVARAPVGDGDLGSVAVRRREARGAARRVEGDVAAADDHDAVADRHGPAEVELAQELDRREAAVEVVALGRRRGAGVQAGGQEHGLVAVGQQAVDGEVDAGALVEAQVDAEGADLVDLALQHVRAACDGRGCRRAACRRPPAAPRTRWWRSRTGPGRGRSSGRPGRRR